MQEQVFKDFVLVFFFNYNVRTNYYYSGKPGDYS